MHERRHVNSQKDLITVNKAITPFLPQRPLPRPQIPHKPRMGQFEVVHHHFIPAPKTHDLVIDLKRHPLIYPQPVINRLENTKKGPHI